jgi:hypothetical protein
MRIPKPVRIAGWVFLALAAFWIWYMVAADYSYGAVAGTYSFRSDGEASTLILKKDRTFQQELTRQGKVESTRGTWRRIGEGGVVFSREFLAVEGQQVRPDGQADGEVQKSFLELIPSIVFEPGRVHGPRFHKKWFR